MPRYCNGPYDDKSLERALATNGLYRTRLTYLPVYQLARKRVAGVPNSVEAYKQADSFTLYWELSQLPVVSYYALVGNPPHITDVSSRIMVLHPTAAATVPTATS